MPGVIVSVVQVGRVVGHLVREIDELGLDHRTQSRQVRLHPRIVTRRVVNPIGRS